MNTDWMAPAYEKANNGDWTDFAAHVAPNYTHQVPAAGLSYGSRDEAIAGLKQRYSDAHMRQTVTSVDQHGGFVIAKVHATADIWPQPIDAVHVFRVENDQFVSLLASYPPPPAS